MLSVENLSVDLPTPAGLKAVVRGVSFVLGEAGSLGVVGESGSGKTMTALALMGLLPEGARVGGAIRFAGRDLARLPEREMQRLRGDQLAMVFQEPMTALNPLHRVGDQVGEPLRWHRGLARGAAREAAVKLLARVRLREPSRLARAHPFQLSGGERQRVMIAMALACQPRLLIADEPTTALDVTVQAQILDLIATLGAEGGMAVLLVSHDLAVVARHCREVLVMYGGAVMEAGPAEAVLNRPLHPYTRALIAARPQWGAPRGQRLQAIPGVASAGGAGCPFASRCPAALPICALAAPPVVALANGQSVACVRVTRDGRFA